MTLPLELLDLGGTVTFRAVIIALRQLLMWCVVVALCALIVALVYSLLWPINYVVKHASFGLVGGVPGTHAVEQAVTNALAGAVTNLDKTAGSFWHALKTLTGQVAEEVFGLAVLAGYILWYVQSGKAFVALYKAIEHAIAGSDHAKATAGSAAKSAAVTKAIANSLAHTGAYTATIPAVARSNAVDRYINARVSAAEAAIAGTLEPEYADLRARTKALEDSAVRAYESVKGLWRVVSIGTVAAVAAVALSRLGLGWLRCRNVKSVGKKLCGLNPSLLEDLLGLSLALLAVVDPEAIAKIAITTTDAASDIIGKVAHYNDPA